MEAIEIDTVKPIVKSYCNLIAMGKGLDPGGSAGDFDDAIVLEVPLPWKNTMYHEAGALPQEVINLLGLWSERYRAGQGYRHRSLMVAPDAAYSQKGHRRVMFYTRQPGMFARFSKIEYLVPEAEMGALIWALYEAPDDLSRFDIYLTPEHDLIREILVCTHGTVDAACAKFGYPLYNYLRKHHATENLRVWRVSHFGGHVFAPTMMDMPTGHYWAYVEEAQAAQIVQQSGDVGALYGHYRGWAGLEDGFLQAAERELWMRYGWDWFAADKSGEMIATGDNPEDPEWAEVRIDYMLHGSSETGSYRARVEVCRRITTSHSTNSDVYPYPQYRVTEF
ncbi:MAG TPA: sucrase ferredoxin [Phototrophicaceae bacterium]|nr:sucrase ferredoxin [Phototrophicaceae bacterium]